MVAITGAMGFLGSHLLASIPHSISIQRDVRTNEKRFNEWLDLHRPETVIHCAGLADVRLSIAHPGMAYESNTVGTITLLNCLEGRNIKLIYIATDKVFGAQERCEFFTPYRPISPYDASKVAAEVIFNDWSKRNIGVLARFPNFYGWDDPHTERLIPSVLKAIASKTTEFSVRTYKDARRQYIFIDDAVALVKRLLEFPNEGSKHHFGPRIIKSVRQVVEDLCREFGASMTLHEERLPGEAPSLSIEHSTPLPVTFTTWEDSLKIIVDRVKAQTYFSQ
jgi:nucleoside-diphosphate-sugar epimerase